MSTDPDPGPGAAPRRLLLMRHAKAATYGEDDHGRDLTDQGRSDAAEAGRWLAARGLVPTDALVSSAKRTTQTWLDLAEASGCAASPTYDDALFTAGPDAMLEVIRAAEPSAQTLVVIGHNPTVAYLAQLLSDGLADAEVLRATSQDYPPCALTVFEVAVAWAELDQGTARATGFHVGRG